MNKLIRLALMVGVFFVAFSDLAIADPLADAARAYDVKNYSKAARLYKPLAQKGNARAQFWLGALYYNGEGINKDLKEAEKWFRLSAEQGDASAQSFLGGMYYYGNGVSEDYAESMKWNQLAAEQGHPVSQYLLGEMNYKGIGVPVDYLKGVKWYRLAAEQGFVDAQLMLSSWYGVWGEAIYSGLHENAKIEDIPKDYLDVAEAFKWEKKAAEQGNPQAEFGVGVSYSGGNEVSQDLKEAFKWFRRAAVQGYTAAQTALGSCYATGKGVPQDYVRAYMWLNIAVTTGEAKHFKKLAGDRDALAAKMTPQQIAEAQKLSRECPAKKYEGC